MFSHVTSARAIKVNINIAATRRLFIRKPFKRSKCHIWTFAGGFRARLQNLWLAALEVYHPKEFQYDKYDGDNDQNMNPITGAREAWTDVPTEKAEQPQDD